MMMILDTLKFDYVDKLQRIWPNINSLFYIATFNTPNSLYNWTLTA